MRIDGLPSEHDWTQILTAHTSKNMRREPTLRKKTKMCAEIADGLRTNIDRGKREADGRDGRKISRPNIFRMSFSAKITIFPQFFARMTPKIVIFADVRKLAHLLLNILPQPIAHMTLGDSPQPLLKMKDSILYIDFLISQCRFFTRCPRKILLFSNDPQHAPTITRPTP